MTLSKIISCLTAQSTRFSKTNSRLPSLRSILCLKRLSLVELQKLIHFMAKNNNTSATSMRLLEMIITCRREMGSLSDSSERRKLCMKSCSRKLSSIVKPLLKLTFRIKFQLQPKLIMEEARKATSNFSSQIDRSTVQMALKISRKTILSKSISEGRML